MNRKILVAAVLLGTVWAKDEEKPIKDISYIITNGTKEPMEITWDSGDQDHPQYARNGRFTLGAGKSGSMTVWQSNCVHTVVAQSQIVTAARASIENVCFAAPMKIEYEGTTLKITADAAKMQLPQ